MASIGSVNSSNSTNTQNQISQQQEQSKPQSGNLAGISVKSTQAPSESPTANLSTQKTIKSPAAEAIDAPVAPAANATTTRVGSTTGVDNATPAGRPTSLQVVGTPEFRQQVAADLNKFAPGTTVDSQGFVRAAQTQEAGHQQGYQLINNLLNNPNQVKISFADDDAFTSSDSSRSQGTPTRPNVGSTAEVGYDPDIDIALPTRQADGSIRDEKIDPAVVLAHELVHATHAQQGTINRTNVNHTFTENGETFQENWRFEEFRTTGFNGARQGNEPTENSIRAELGYNPRATYLDRSGWTKVD